MKKFVSAFLTVGFVLGMSSQGQTAKETAEEAKSINIETVTCASVEDRLPVQEGTQFDASTERVYFWNKVITEETPTTIQHVWYADGKKINAVELNIGGSPWRTWSYKTVWPADWTVQAVNAQGEVLASADIKVTGESKSEATTMEATE